MTLYRDKCFLCGTDVEMQDTDRGNRILVHCEACGSYEITTWCIDWLDDNQDRIDWCKRGIIEKSQHGLPVIRRKDGTQDVIITTREQE